MGVPVCLEVVKPRIDDCFVDPEGTLVFWTKNVISFELKDATVRQVLDEIVKQAPEYEWSVVPGTPALLNIVPKNSVLTFQMGKIDVADSPDRVLMFAPGFEKLRPAAPSGPFNLRVQIARASGTAREVLNDMARQHVGLTWQYRYSSGWCCHPPNPDANPAQDPINPNPNFGYVRQPLVQAIDLQYDVRRGMPLNGPNIFRPLPDYREHIQRIVNREVAGRFTYVVEKDSFDLVARHAAGLADPDYSLIKRCTQFLRAFLREDTTGVVEFLAPEGAQRRSRTVTRDEYKQTLETVFQRDDYRRFKLDEVLALDDISVKQVSATQYRVSSKLKPNFVKGQTYFGIEWGCTFEKSKDARWMIVELD
jgi:hypothetical protein